MSDVDIANDGEQFSRMLSRSLEQLTKRGLEATKDDFKQASKKMLEPRAKTFGKISPRSKRKKNKHLQDSFSYAFDEDKQEASIKSTKTGNLVNWLDHGHVYHTKKGDKFWQGKLKGQYTKLKKEAEDALIEEFTRAFGKS